MCKNMGTQRRLSKCHSGQTRDVLVPATFTAQGNTGVFDGMFTLRRGDFSIGEGAWAKFDIVANDVQVRVRLHASSK